jgi:hypothetical protein
MGQLGSAGRRGCVLEEKACPRFVRWVGWSSDELLDC